MSRVKNGKAAANAGMLGEFAASRILGLSEPVVEVKSTQLERGKVSIELTQLERQPDKVYVIVIYARGKRKGKGGRGRVVRSWERTIPEAFKGSLDFIVVDTDRFIELIKIGAYSIRWVTADYRKKARFVACFEIDDLKCGTVVRTVGDEQHGLHSCYSTKQVMERL